MKDNKVEIIYYNSRKLQVLYRGGTNKWKLNLESIPLKQYKIDSEPIIFPGWIFANNIQGYKKVRDKANIKCTIAVGMTPPAKQNNSEIIKINNVYGEFFYLQGGVDYTKLKGIKRFMLKMVAESVIKENKPEDKELIDIFLNGGNNVKEENLSEIIAYLTNYSL